MNKKIALVTGGTSGIGKAIVEALLNEGYHVFVNYINTDQAESFKRKVKSPNYELIEADITDRKQVEDMKEIVQDKFKKIYLLVNNAGVMIDKTFEKMSYKEFDKVIEVNLKGTFNVTKEFLPLIKNNGRIINISSISGVYGQFGQTNYASSKAGIIAFTKSLAKETAKRGITVNAVAPGIINTDITRNIDEKILERLKNRIPLGKLGMPEDIANAVVFLASSKAKYITRHTLHVDGGLTF